MQRWIAHQINETGGNSVKLFKASLCLSLFIYSVSNCYADAWQERETLSRVREQLIRINKLLNEAENAGAENPGRLRMEYGSIREDLNTIENGIYQYVNTPMEPAAVVPLSGGYTDYQRAANNTKIDNNNRPASTHGDHK
jgi:Plasmid protein of unknown function (Plasmid_RAQPRD).